MVEHLTAETFKRLSQFYMGEEKSFNLGNNSGDDVGGMDMRGLESELMKFCSCRCQDGGIKEDARFQGWVTRQW